MNEIKIQTMVTIPCQKSNLQEDQKEYKEEIELKCSFDIDHLCSMQRVKRVRISERFFGPPGSMMSPSWKQRVRLMKRLGSLCDLEELVIEGTVMGQVIPGETLGLAIPSQLKRLQVDFGLILDDMYSAKMIARALDGHKHLTELKIFNFANHATDQGDHEALLDPVVMALSSIPTLQTVELSCLASFTRWDRSYIREEFLFALFSLPRLRRANLTNLGLEDSHFSAISSNIGVKGPLQQLLLNGNYNSLHGLETMVRLLESNRSLVILELENNVKMTDAVFDLLRRNLEQNTVLHSFSCTYKVRSSHQSAIDCFLKMNRLGLREAFFDPMAKSDKCVHILAQVNNDADCLLYLLREKPSICNLEMNSIPRTPQHHCCSRFESNTLFGLLLLLLTLVLAHFVDASSSTHVTCAFRREMIHQSNRSNFGACNNTVIQAQLECDQTGKIFGSKHPVSRSGHCQLESI
jgi:hypothetical protein